MSKKMHRPEKAYKNLDFLNSSDARTIRILSEFYEPKSRFKENKISDTIVFFGSARIKDQKEAKKSLTEFKKTSDPKKKNYAAELKRHEKNLDMSQYYEDAVELSKRITEWSLKTSEETKRFTICSGGGPGIMEAANKGAKLAGGSSVGLNISIPFEQFVNKWVDPKLVFEFHYFFMRKFWFVYLAKAFVIFPGGFGTFDELMEVLTLMQTGKIKKKIKLIIYDSKYWKRVINFDTLIEDGVISKSDMKLFDFCETVDEAFEKVTKHMQNNYGK